MGKTSFESGGDYYHIKPGTRVQEDHLQFSVAIGVNKGMSEKGKNMEGLGDNQDKSLFHPSFNPNLYNLSNRIN